MWKNRSLQVKMVKDAKVDVQACNHLDPDHIASLATELIERAAALAAGLILLKTACKIIEKKFI